MKDLHGTATAVPLQNQGEKSDLVCLSGFDGKLAGVGAENHETHDGGAGEQEHAQHSGMQGGVAQQNSQQTEGSAGGTEGEIQALTGVGGVAQENEQHRGDDGVDSEQRDSARYSIAVQRKGLGVREGGLQGSDAQEDDGMDERDDGALAAVENGKRVHGEQLVTVIILK